MLHRACDGEKGRETHLSFKYDINTVTCLETCTSHLKLSMSYIQLFSISLHNGGGDNTETVHFVSLQLTQQ